MKVIATNRQARRNYHLLDAYEAGIELKGAEVKSLREGRADLKDSFARIEDNGVNLYHLHINPYRHSRVEELEAKRTRRLLLHKREIRKLAVKARERGFTLIPLQLYFNDQGLAKVEIRLAKGKNACDRREEIKKKEADLEIRRSKRGKG